LRFVAEILRQKARFCSAHGKYDEAGGVTREPDDVDNRRSKPLEVEGSHPREKSRQRRYSERPTLVSHAKPSADTAKSLATEKSSAALRCFPCCAHLLELLKGRPVDPDPDPHPDLDLDTDCDTYFDQDTELAAGEDGEDPATCPWKAGDDAVWVGITGEKVPVQVLSVFNAKAEPKAQRSGGAASQVKMQGKATRASFVQKIDGRRKSIADNLDTMLKQKGIVLGTPSCEVKASGLARCGPTAARPLISAC
jgi:hypothetical protein